MLFVKKVFIFVFIIYKTLQFSKKWKTDSWAISIKYGITYCNGMRIKKIAIE